MCCEDCKKKAKKYFNYCGFKICSACIDRNYEVVNGTAIPKKKQSPGQRGRAETTGFSR